MCYNKVYADHSLSVGQVVISKKGHDTNKIFVVVGVLNTDFVLIADGKSRGIAKLKQKRTSHLKILGQDEQLKTKIAARVVCDSDIIEAISKFPCKKMFF